MKYIPMVELYLDHKIWKAVEEPINHKNKLEYFESMDGWKSIRAEVVINGITKECDVYLNASGGAWVSWHEFEPNLLEDVA